MSVKSEDGGLVALPTSLKEAITDLLRYTGLLYGREKAGKTTFMSSFPEALFLSTEPGTKGLRIFEYNAEKGGCKNWALVRQAVDLLEQTTKFKTVIIDTVDRAYDMCLDWTCEELNIPYPGKTSSGKEDFGASWREVRMEFMSICHRIIQTGRGLWFTSHSKEETINSRSGNEYMRIFPTMSGQARRTVEALVDFFFYVEYVQDADGNRQRVIITEGDEVVWAGAREIDSDQQIALPRFLPMLKRGGFEMLQAAFDGEDVGLDERTLKPTPSATKAIKKFLNVAALDAEQKGGRKKVRRQRRA